MIHKWDLLQPWVRIDQVVMVEKGINPHSANCESRTLNIRHSFVPYSEYTISCV